MPQQAELAVIRRPDAQKKQLVSYFMVRSEESSSVFRNLEEEDEIVLDLGLSQRCL